MAVSPWIKDRPSPVEPAGEDKGFKLALLEKGAAVLQDTAPLHGFDVYVVGFHPGKDDPHMQMEAHHYCRVVNDDFRSARFSTAIPATPTSSVWSTSSPSGFSTLFPKRSAITGIRTTSRFSRVN